MMLVSESITNYTRDLVGVVANKGFSLYAFCAIHATTNPSPNNYVISNQDKRSIGFNKLIILTC